MFLFLSLSLFCSALCHYLQAFIQLMIMIHVYTILVVTLNRVYFIFTKFFLFIFEKIRYSASNSAEISCCCHPILVIYIMSLSDFVSVILNDNKILKLTFKSFSCGFYLFQTALSYKYAV